jgi:hypothetical protein
MVSNNAKEVHSMHGSIILALPIAVMLVVPSTHAAGLDSKERAAKKACLNGDSAKGVSILTDLYVDTNDATYIFNQGRCLEQNSRYKDAIARFREYLRKAGDQTEAERAAVQKHIDDCEALLKKGGSRGARCRVSQSTSVSRNAAGSFRAIFTGGASIASRVSRCCITGTGSLG